MYSKIDSLVKNVSTIVTN